MKSSDLMRKATEIGVGQIFTESEVKRFLILMRAFEALKAEEDEKAHQRAMSAIEDDR